jgi:hypothetical protein
MRKRLRINKLHRFLVKNEQFAGPFSPHISAKVLKGCFSEKRNERFSEKKSSSLNI